SSRRRHTRFSRDWSRRVLFRSMSDYAVQHLPVGRGDIPGPELFWMGGWDEWYTLLFQAVLIRGNGVTALVNTGPARNIGPMNERWKQVLGERSAMRRADDEFILDQLAKHDVRPEDVT